MSDTDFYEQDIAECRKLVAEWQASGWPVPLFWRNRLKRDAQYRRKVNATVQWRLDKQQRQENQRGVIYCGARTRCGTDCRAKVVPGSCRCRLHGGMSTGPKSDAGRAAIAESNRRRATCLGL